MTIAEKTTECRALGLFVKSIMVFPLIYSVSFFENFKFISTERISLIILLIYAFSFGNKRMGPSEARHNVLRMFFLQLFLLVYSSLILLAIGTGNGTNILTYIVNFLILVPVELYCLNNLFKNNDELMYVLFIVSMIQALIITGTLIDPSFANFVDTTFNVGSYYDYQHMRKVWYPGGISCITSVGALKLSLGVISGMYLFQKTNGNVIYLILTLFIIVISTIVARTGLFIGVTAIVLLLLNMDVKRSNVLIILGSAIIAAFIGVVVYFLMANDGGTQTLFTRLIALKENGIYEAFLKGYVSSRTTVIPELSWKTIIGTGIVSGESGNEVVINADGGFIRMFCAVGLPLAMLFYGSLFYRMLRSVCLVRANSIVHYAVTLLLFIMVMGEFKEPFFYTRYLFVFFYLVIYFYERDNGYLRCNGCLTKF